MFFCIKIHWITRFYQYYYSVRVFAGQEPSGIWVGWITPDYHQYDPHFDMNKVRNVTVTVGDDKGNIHDRYGRFLFAVKIHFWV